MFSFLLFQTCLGRLITKITSVYFVSSIDRLISTPGPNPHLSGSALQVALYNLYLSEHRVKQSEPKILCLVFLVLLERNLISIT